MRLAKYLLLFIVFSTAFLSGVSARYVQESALAQEIQQVRQEAEKIANPSRSIVVYEDKTTQPSQTGTPAPTGFKRFTSWFNR